MVLRKMKIVIHRVREYYKDFSIIQVQLSERVEEVRSVVINSETEAK